MRLIIEGGNLHPSFCKINHARSEIVIIDSGCSPHTAFVGNDLEGVVGVTISQIRDKYNIDNGCDDDIGHGTAVNYILSKGIQRTNLYNIKIFNDKSFNSPNLLLIATFYL